MKDMAELTSQVVQVLAAATSEIRNTMFTIHLCGMICSTVEQYKKLLLSLGNIGSTHSSIKCVNGGTEQVCSNHSTFKGFVLTEQLNLRVMGMSGHAASYSVLVCNIINLH